MIVQKYITTQEFNRLSADNFIARLKQGNLASNIDNFIKKADFDNKLLSFNKSINLNKTKHALVENELNELSKKLEQYQPKYQQKI